MAGNPLESLTAYSQFIAELVNRTSIKHTTLTVCSDSPHTGIAESELFFSLGFRLRLREELDFEARLITSYGYEFYKNEQRLFWYDDFPHPQIEELAATFPTTNTFCPVPIATECRRRK